MSNFEDGDERVSGRTGGVIVRNIGNRGIIKKRRSVDGCMRKNKVKLGGAPVSFWCDLLEIYFVEAEEVCRHRKWSWDFGCRRHADEFDPATPFRFSASASGS